MSTLLNLSKNRIFAFIALLSGASLTLAFAPFNFYATAFIAPLLLLFSWLNVSPKKAFWRGWLFGLGFFGTGVSWVYVSVHVYGNTNALVAGTLTALFVMVLALFPALQGYLCNRLFPRSNTAKLIIGFPILWVLFEWMRSWIFTGFPWLFLGNSQIDSGLNSYIPIIGVYGVSWLVALNAGLILHALHSVKRCLVALLLLFALWLSAALLQTQEWTQAEGEPVQVSLIQGNVPQELKWQREYLSNILATYEDLTQRHWDSQIIVWPEAAIPMLANQAGGFLKKIDQQAKSHNTTLITGIPEQTPNNEFYNALFVLGVNQGHYYKRHLVPFGEYLPFASYLRGLINFFNIPMSSFSKGAERQADIHAGGLVISPFICYEIAYPQLVRDSINGAQALLTISDDSWFGRSIAPEQHLQIAQMRSLETGKEQLFSTNDGVTAIIDAKGQVVSRIPRYKTTVLSGEIQAMNGTTPWVKMGFLPLLGGMLILLLLALFRRNK